MSVIRRYFQRITDSQLRFASVAITVTSLALALATLWLGGRVEQNADLPEAFLVLNAQRPWLVVMISLCAILGGLLTYRLVRLTYGWLWVWLAATFTFIAFARWYTAYGLLVAEDGLPLMHFIAWLSYSAWCAGMAITCLILLLFPDGALPSPRWRLLVWVILALATATFLTGAFLPGVMTMIPWENPAPWLPAEWVAPMRQVNKVAQTGLVLCVFVSGLSVFLRLRKTQGVERQQLKWFAIATLTAMVYFALQALPSSKTPISLFWNDMLGAMIYLLLALAVVISLLRYRLYDIDLILRRSLTYAVVTTLLAGIYLGVVILAQGVLIQLTGQTSAAALVLSTLATAALFNPLRMRVQDAVDGRYFRRKYDADVVLQAFSSLARDETDLEKLMRELTSVVRETMQPTEVRVWLRGGPERGES